MRFGTWNARTLYRAGSLTAAAARVLERYKLDLAGMLVRWKKGGKLRAEDYNFCMEEETKIINWEQDFFVHHRIVTAVKRVEFAVVVIILNVHASSEEKSDDSKDGFYKEIQQVFDHFP